MSLREEWTQIYRHNPIIIFANEFFDALPVEVLSPQGKLVDW